MPNYAEGLKYTDEQKQVYERVLNAVPLDYQIKRTIKHRDALPAALETLKGKEFASIDAAVETLTDALIKYRKSTKMPVSEDKDDRHLYANEVRDFLEAYGKQNKVDVLSLIKKGEAHTLLMSMLENDKAHDLEGKLNYEMRKLLPADKDMDFYQGIMHYHASLNPTVKFSKGQIAKMSSHEGVLGVLKDSYDRDLASKLQSYKPEQKKAA
jgi:hypothetical protein